MTIGEIGEISDLPITLHIHTPYFLFALVDSSGNGLVGNNRRITDFTYSTD